MNKQTLHELQAQIAAAFPTLPLRTLTRLQGGKAADVFLANANANDAVIFKIPLPGEVGGSDLAREFEALTALQNKLEIPIPLPICYGTLPDGREILGESFVPGTPFSQDAYETFTPSEKDALFAQLGEIFHQIHTAQAPQIKKADVFNPSANLKAFRENYTQVQAALPPDDRTLLEQLARDFETLPEAAVPLCICHGDMHFWNMNYDPATKKINALLDFGIVCYNDPLNDMRYFWSDSVEIMLRHYPTDIGPHADTRHRLYCLANLLGEANDEIQNSNTRVFIDPVQHALRFPKLSRG